MSFIDRSPEKGAHRRSSKKSRQTNQLTDAAVTQNGANDIRRFRRMVLGNRGSVECICFSADGTLVGTAYSTGDVNIWSPQTEISRSMSRHPGRCTHLDFSPDCKNIVSCGAGGRIIQWSSRADTELKEFEGHQKMVWQVKYNQDGSRFASCSVDNSVRVWNPGTGACVAVLTGHTAAVTTIAFNSEGVLASGSWDQSIIIWDLQGKSIRHQLQGHTGNVSSIVFSDDNLLLASGSSDCTVKIWNPKDASCFETLEEHGADISKVALVGSNLVSVAMDGTAWRMDISDGKIFDSKTAHLGAIFDIAFSPDGSVFCTASEDGSVVLWNVAADTVICRFVSPDQAPLLKVAFSPDGTKLVAGSKSGLIVIWNLLPVPDDEEFTVEEKDETEVVEKRGSCAIQ